jgi:peptide/nickel transport system permease protein
MAKLIAYRLLLAVPQLIVSPILAFSLTYLIPGSPAAAILGVSATPDSVAALETQLGLDEPAPARLVDYLGDAVQGDFGESYRLRKPGYRSGARTDAGDPVDGVRWGDRRSRARLSRWGSSPGPDLTRGVTGSSWVARQWRSPFRSSGSGCSCCWCSINLKWMPVVAYTPFTDNPLEWARGMILPSLSLGVAASGLIARQMRAGMARCAQLQLRRFAHRSRGVPAATSYLRYGIKNAMVPVLAATGLTFAILVGASFGIERVFSVPGVGSLMLGSVTGKDYPVVQGAVVLIAVFVIVLNILDRRRLRPDQPPDPSAMSSLTELEVAQPEDQRSRPSC